MNWWAQYSTRYMKFSRYTCEDQFLFYFACRFFFISSDLAHRAPITTSVAVRLFAPDRDSCVLASSCGLPLVLLQWSMSQFSLRIRTSIVAAYFFIYYRHSFLFRHVFLQPEPTLDYMKQASFIFTHPPEDQKQETKKRNKKNDSRHGHRQELCI